MEIKRDKDEERMVWKSERERKNVKKTETEGVRDREEERDERGKERESGIKIERKVRERQ